VPCPLASRRPHRLQHLLPRRRFRCSRRDRLRRGASSDETHLRQLPDAVAVAGRSTRSCGHDLRRRDIVSVAVLPVDETGTAWSADDEWRPILALPAPLRATSRYTRTIRTPSSTRNFDSPFHFKGDVPTDCDGGAGRRACAIRPTTSSCRSLPRQDFDSFRRRSRTFAAPVPLVGRAVRSGRRRHADGGPSRPSPTTRYLQARVPRGDARDGDATRVARPARSARRLRAEPADRRETSCQIDVVGCGRHRCRLRVRCRALARTAWLVRLSSWAARLADSETVKRAGDRLPGRRALERVAAAGLVGREPPLLPARSTLFWLIGTGIGLSAGQQLLSACRPDYGPTPRAGDRDDRRVRGDYRTPSFAVSLLVSTRCATALDTISPPQLAGNLVPAVQGARVSETSRILYPSAAPPLPGVPGRSLFVLRLRRIVHVLGRSAAGVTGSTRCAAESRGSRSSRGGRS